MDVMLLDEAGERVERRKALIELVRETYQEKQGALLFLAGFERDREPFYQESTFDYFFGIQEPSLVVYQELNGQPILFVPHYGVDRSAWCPVTYDEEHLAALDIVRTEFLGQKIKGYSVADPFYTHEAVENLVALLTKQCATGESIFVSLADASIECRAFIKQLELYVPNLSKALVDIAPLVAQLRRTKSQTELEYMYEAAEITAMAQQAAAGVIKKGNSEADVQAAIEYIFTESGARPAFASIVGSGVNGTILHYTHNNAQLPDKSLVVVDSGASFRHYCCDVTRTYPVSGAFSPRQKQVYQDVLDCQSYIAQLAKPGMFLSNRDEPTKCLNTLAHQFLKERGYDVEKQFPHGIGHFVGLDVHDVGDRLQPLAPGDIITIEPGIYLREEQLGVRIEDVYWIVKDGNVCLTDQVPKKITEVEQFMINARFTDDEAHPTGPHEH